MQLKTNVLYSAKMIEDRVSSLAQQIQQSYPKDEKPIICLCVLRGAVLFFADLMKKMDDERIRFDFITLSSYESTSTTGNIKLVQDLRSDVKDAHVLSWKTSSIRDILLDILKIILPTNRRRT